MGSELSFTKTGLQTEPHQDKLEGTFKDVH